MKKYFLGVDVSTTATKALLMDENGEVIAVYSSSYPFDTPHPLWSEQDPKVWWNGTQIAIKAILERTGISPDSIKAVGLTGQMHGLVLLDDKGAVLRPAILWNDQRTQSQCEDIHKRIGLENFINTTGNVALTGFTAPKIRWVSEHEPEIYGRIRHILLPKDYVRYCLTGDFAADKGGASGTVLFDLKKRDWSWEILDALEINPDWMPKTYEGTHITGVISGTASKATGLAAGTPVVAGGGDQQAQAVGVGAVIPGTIGLAVGTSGVIFATTPTALTEPSGRLHSFCHALPDTWHLMGVMLSAAGSLQWYRDRLAPGLNFESLLKPVEDVPAGSEGLFFLPYLSGERTPHPDPYARGAFIGLTVRHTQAHMTRAVLEGVAYGLKDILNLIEQSGLERISHVRLSGGGARSKIWQHIIASGLNCELVIVNTAEGAAYGAALIAGVGVGVWSDIYTACNSCIKVTDKIYPTSDNVISYEKGHEVFKDLYPALKSVFPRLIM